MEKFQEVVVSQQKKEESKDAFAAGLVEKLSVKDEKASEEVPPRRRNLKMNMRKSMQKRGEKSAPSTYGGNVLVSTHVGIPSNVAWLLV